MLLVSAWPPALVAVAFCRYSVGPFSLFLPALLRLLSSPVPVAVLVMLLSRTKLPDPSTRQHQPPDVPATAMTCSLPHRLIFSIWSRLSITFFLVFAEQADDEPFMAAFPTDCGALKTGGPQCGLLFWWSTA